MEVGRQKEGRRKEEEKKGKEGKSGKIHNSCKYTV